MAIILKCSRWLLVFVVLMATALSGCRFFKKTITKQSRDSTVSSEVQIQVLTRQVQRVNTVEFGDTLQFDGFLPVIGGSVSNSSKGIDANLTLTPVYNSEKTLVGYHLKNKSIAKPTKSVESETTSITDKNKQQRQFSQVKMQSKHIEITKKGLPIIWWVWLLLLILLFTIYQAIKFYKEYVG